ncbi:MAG: hypothetical protein R3Y21_04670 [Mycoplasmatota bacterium]
MKTTYTINNQEVTVRRHFNENGRELIDVVLDLLKQKDILNEEKKE